MHSKVSIHDCYHMHRYSVSFFSKTELIGTNHALELFYGVGGEEGTYPQTSLKIISVTTSLRAL